ncbi:3'-5' exonuclease [Coraliomargarita sp. SDUM461003]|uniref:3'-5' exonuclease n=1 Tax=Thalassobacterium maritimum TaxID=3041265 RepID=A0ABU1AZ83_9BACT|nr:3'-5' exonuclease [Coraliomargarita sp. SDUM461003]MDQ8209468.1 3'-5' exonuclease [Coraliomargarita sp. SDUM461003]
MHLIIDTETTGLTPLSFVTERNYKQWPRMIQIAWGLVGKDSIEIDHRALIRPDGFKIPYSAMRIHGITQQQAEEEGEDLQLQLKTLNNVMKDADSIVAHNLNFDLGIIQSEAMRIDFPLTFPEKRYCTAYMGQTYLRKEKKQRLANFPRLGELHKELLGFDYEPKHDALADVIACAGVFEHLRRLGYAK